MKTFMTENFLLTNKVGQELYHQYAAAMPIIDYHCHLSPQEIAEDRRYQNITEVWLGGDHYKWRIMRAYGVEERYITGDATPEQKFAKWAEVLPYAIGNPLQHWSAMELQTYFGVDEVLSATNWQTIYEQCNKVVQSPGFSAQALIKQSGVEWICTTDDPADDLRYHRQIAEQADFTVQVTPTFRPDKVLDITHAEYLAYVSVLAEQAKQPIVDFASLQAVLIARIDHFAAHGCFISDHAFKTVPYARATDEEVEAIFAKRLAGAALTASEVEQYQTALFLFLGRQYAARKWAAQIHVGAIRNVNTRMATKLGVDTGYDFIGDYTYSEKLAALLNALDQTDELPKTILYNLNAMQNDVLATLAGTFQAEGIRAKMQFGAPWWFNDQKDGLIKHFNSLANLGVLGCFVGMLTDSRSFLSYPRHDYFRRVLCNQIGAWVEAGEVAHDEAFLGQLVQGISYHNAATYFELTDRIGTEKE